MKFVQRDSPDIQPQSRPDDSMHSSDLGSSLPPSHWLKYQARLQIPAPANNSQDVVPGSETRAMTTKPIGGPAKRVVDIVFASAALVFLLPLFGLVACLVKLSDGGPVLYRHPRVGYGGRAFDCMKFRTMVVNADEVLREHLTSSPRATREWAETRKLKKDPRVTAVGAVLRKVSVDELPQLINILRGHMSIVGPRPIVSEEIAKYGPHFDVYSSAIPGLTGLWQVSGRSDQSYDVRVGLDCAYVRNWSFAGDIKIIVRTIPVVLSSRGTY